ncbi:hypothetical protein ACFX12_026887 [Malus domestica]
MAKPVISLFSFLSIISLLTLTSTASALPLSTSSRWIVDESKRCVKLTCVNWASHLDAVVAECLSKQPDDAIASLRFNCVKLTWPLSLATKEMVAAVTVRQSFQSLDLLDSISGI